MTIIEKLNDLKKYLLTSKTVLGKSVIDVDKIKEIELLEFQAKKNWWTI